MAKRPLRQWMREKLIAHATKNVSPVKEAKALASAYKKAEPLVRKIVEAKFKPDDMLICSKYGLTQRDTCIRVQFPNGAVQQFDFTDKNTAPIVAHGSCYNRMYLADEKSANAIETWVTARDTFKTEAKRRIQAYTALVQASGSVDDVIKAWPEAADLIPPASEMIPINPEQIAILQADMRERETA